MPHHRPSELFTVDCLLISGSGVASNYDSLAFDEDMDVSSNYSQIYIAQFCIVQDLRTANGKSGSIPIPHPQPLSHLKGEGRHNSISPNPIFGIWG